MKVCSALFELCVALGVVELLELVELVELIGAIASPDVRLGNAEIFMVFSSLTAARSSLLSNQTLHVNIKS
jgi:hypothetical protein